MDNSPPPPNQNRKANYAKVNTDELFKSVDIDNNGTIEKSEWLEFWQEVKRQGHTEEDILEEVTRCGMPKTASL